MPGSPRFRTSHIQTDSSRALHPLAWILTLGSLGVGIAVVHSWFYLAASAALLGWAALRAERRPLRAESSILFLALVVFLAHALLAPRDEERWAEAAAIALRLLALIYLLRWGARAAFGRVGRWLMQLRTPQRPRLLLLLMESARLTAALLPLALREAEQHAAALKSRGIRIGRGLRGFARYLLAWFLPFLGTALRISESYADALMARGYRPGQIRRAGLRTPWGLREWGAVCGSAAVAVWFLRAR